MYPEFGLLHLEMTPLTLLPGLDVSQLFINHDRGVRHTWSGMRVTVLCNRDRLPIHQHVLAVERGEHTKRQAAVNDRAQYSHVRDTDIFG